MQARFLLFGTLLACTRDGATGSPAEVSTGRAPPPMLSSTDTRIHGGQMAHMGLALSAQLDVNGDGATDLAVGGETGVLIYHGGAAGLDATPGSVIQVSTDGAWFGRTLTTGDYDGDGYDDLAVYEEPDETDWTRVCLFYGSADGITARSAAEADLCVLGEETESDFGVALASGDVNGDGLSDLVVGASRDASKAGTLYIFYGVTGGFTATTAADADVSILGNSTGSYFGTAVATGDINGDGYADVVGGAPYAKSETGRIYIFHGAAGGISATEANDAERNIVGEDTWQHFGDGLSAAGDVNGDGYGDLLVGAAEYPSNGRAYLFLGSASGIAARGAADADTTLTGASDAEIGAVLAVVGDVDGDGYDDIAIGDTQRTSYTGGVYLFYGGASGVASGDTSTAAATVMGEATLDYFGSAVAGIGDINGDGRAELAVGAYNAGPSAGRAYLFYGAASGPGAAGAAGADATVQGESPSNYFGYSVASAGDVNGDGLADMLVGAYWVDWRGYGSIYLYHGSSEGIRARTGFEADRQIMSDEKDSFGIAVAGAGDLDADGYDDVVVGAYGYEEFRGRAFVFTGGPDGVAASALDEADQVWLGQNASDAFGGAVAGAGDPNGDGYADLVIGAYPYQDVKGRVYLFLGGADGSMATDVSAADGLIDGEIEHGKLGRAVANAGDLDGDGRSDLVIGAPGDEYEDTTGYAYIFNGDAALGEHVASDADNTVVGASYLDEFGLAVSSGGDVNGDGYDEVLVAASSRDRSHGRVYLFQGSATGIYAIYATEAETTFTGDDVSDRFGISVASAGDVNGDGYGDLLLGQAPSSTHGPGAASLFFGSASGIVSADASMADLTFTSDYATEDWYDHYANAVAGLGDIDGDGADDVAVGDYGTHSHGAVWVYSGSCDEAQTVYADADGDGHGDPARVAARCGAMDGYATTADDCDDGDADAFPGAEDVPADGVDQDCDGEDAAEVLDDTGDEDTGGQDTAGEDTAQEDSGPQDTADSDEVIGGGGDKSGCAGCATGGSAGSFGALALVALLGLSRRRAP